MAAAMANSGHFVPLHVDSFAVITPSSRETRVQVLAAREHALRRPASSAP
jgi:hypothetical protein